MSDSSTIQPPDSAEATDKSTRERDLTGRSRLVSNVLFTWGGQMVFFVSGFIMPRVIDRTLGKEVLGVWDFSWSLVAYFRFVDMGVTASVNRYVARYWGKQDIEGINRVVSSATLALILAGLVMFLGTIVAVVTMPYWFGDSLKGFLSVTQQSVFWLGTMLSMGTALGAYNGVLTGCHRWELQTMRNSTWQFIAVAGMLVALWLGGGLAMLAAITAICQILGQLTMVGLAYKACPGLKLKRSYVHLGTIKELYIYSGKTLLPTVSEMLLNQTTSVLITGSLGLGALAIFTRPRALLRQMDSLERKMAMILIPTTSSLESCGDVKEIENLLVKSTRYSIYLVLPLVIILVVFGGEVMRLWMGPAYANWILPAVLSIGFLGTCIQTPILYMLEGLNAHGRAGVGQFIGSVLSAVAVFISLRFFQQGLTGAAIAVTVPLLVVNIIYLPALLCRRLGQGLGHFYRQVAIQPLIHVAPFAACLVVGRLLFKQYPAAALGLCAVGGVALAIFYWRSVLPRTLKTGLQRRYEKIGRRLGLPFAGAAAK
ncbi:MAG TPA: oligosaccharide flippase family protein [Verrucomicrobiae bacterium]|jgi:O-antigen/teichoic acid export membrane protein|nr:oligosaccharide flippase family protein [Verrucomicrobiae bacterium]